MEGGNGKWSGIENCLSFIEWHYTAYIAVWHTLKSLQMIRLILATIPVTVVFSHICNNLVQRARVMPETRCKTNSWACNRRIGLHYAHICEVINSHDLMCWNTVYVLVFLLESTTCSYLGNEMISMGNKFPIGLIQNQDICHAEYSHAWLHSCLLWHHVRISPSRVLFALCIHVLVSGKKFPLVLAFPYLTVITTETLLYY